MARGAPNKRGLDYFPKMVDFYEDDKIFDLLDRYGPLGVTVYDCILCIVYRHGYYAEIPLDKLSRMITKMIGNKWVKNSKVVVQVVHFCSEIGLLDDDLMTKNIITSVGIQKRFYKIAVKLMKRQLYSEEYWLLEKEEKEEPLLNSPQNGITSEENTIDSEVILKSSEESHIKEKETKINNIYMAPPDKSFSAELEKIFQLFVVCRQQNGQSLNAEQIRLLREELCNLSDKDTERIAIVKKATVSNWKSFYPLKKQGRKTEPKKKANFSNFHGRDYDVQSLEKQLLNSQKGGKDHGQ